MNDVGFKGARADWTDIVLVCRKCSKRAEGGFGKGGDKRLAKCLRKTLDVGDQEDRDTKVAVIEVDCFDICPKNAVVVVTSAAPGDIVIVPTNTPIEAVIERLGLTSGLAKRPDQQA